MDSTTSEQHPYFPSGDWEGVYLYENGPGAERHPMSFELNFREGKITGSGGDDVGPFSWEGSYDVLSMAVKMLKSYPAHQVLYTGMADSSGIYGTWQLSFARGGFHIWPKTNEREEQAVAVGEKEKEVSVV